MKRARQAAPSAPLGSAFTSVRPRGVHSKLRYATISERCLQDTSNPSGCRRSCRAGSFCRLATIAVDLRPGSSGSGALGHQTATATKATRGSTR
jgi:hypothetical protein